MKLRYSKTLSSVAILMAVQVGCSQHKAAGGGGTHPMVLDHNPHRVVTISGATPPNSNPCEVDFPVTLLRIGKHHTIAWYASDHDYWIWFNNLSPLLDPSNPSNPHIQKVYVRKGVQPPFDYQVDIPPQNPSPDDMYSTYAIFDADPGPNPDPSETSACKKSSDERDTGLHVKR